MKRYFPYVLLLIMCAWLFSAGIATIPTQDRDEALYVQATKQMLQTDNYTQINFQTKPRHLKPPGIYWLQALSVDTFSQTASKAMWPFRLVSAVGLTLAVLCLFGFMRDIVGEKPALLGAALLAGSLLSNIEVHIANTDSVLLLTMVLMQCALARAYVNYRKSKPVQWPLFLCFWLAMTAGVVIKGITPLVGFLTLFAIMLFDRNLGFWRAIRPVSGISILILLTLAWLVPVSMAGDSNFLWDMIHGDVLPKLAGGQQSHGQWPGYFLLLLPLMFFPGSALIANGVAKAIVDRKSDVMRFLLAWIVPTWIVFELVPTKLPQYVWPTYPAIAIVVSMAFFEGFEIKSLWRYLARAYRILWLLVVVALAVAIVVMPHRINGYYDIWTWVAAVALVVSALVVQLTARHDNKTMAVVAMMLSALIAWPAAFALVYPNMKNFWLTPKVINLLKDKGVYAELSNRHPLFATGYTEPSLVFNTNTYHVRYGGVSGLVSALTGQHAAAGILLEKQLPSFNAMARKAHLHYQLLGQVHGFRYNGGHWQTVVLVK